MVNYVIVHVILPRLAVDVAHVDVITVDYRGDFVIRCIDEVV